MTKIVEGTKTRNEMWNSALSLTMLPKQIRLLLSMILFAPIWVCGQNVVFDFVDPFTVDCQLVDLPTHQYMKANKMHYLKKTTRTGRSSYHVVEQFYNSHFVLDSVVETNGTRVKKSIYTYDTLQRFISRIDSFKNQKGWDSVYIVHVGYENDRIQRIERSWTYFDQPGFRRFKLFPTIAFDTIMGDMTRYKSCIVDLNGGCMWSGTSPSYYYLQDGNLIIQGSDSVYATKTIEETGDGFEVRYHQYRNDTATLVKISRFDANWQLEASKVWYKGKWVLTEDHRYDDNGRELMNTTFEPIIGIKSNTTFIRDPKSGRVDRTLTPVTVNLGEKLAPRISVSETLYYYSTKK